MSDRTDNKVVDIVRPDPFIEMVERLSTNEAVDPDKLQKIVDIQMQVMDRNAETEFNAAMSRVQAKLPTVYEKAFNPQTQSRYAKLEHIAAVIKPIYTSEGFSTTFSQGKPITEGYMGIDGELRHRNGYKRSNYWLELPPDKEGIKGNVNKTDLHAAGSTFTYGRRYLTCLMFDVATGDDTDAVMETGPPEARIISSKQEGQIRDMLTVLQDADAPNSDEETFCSWAKIDSIETMPAHKFARCMKKLKENTEKIDA